ncbi:Gmad2 immunoglobulin-like domain-containing protein [Terricaulis sp.]|uniref:Gmad2 immunoglobulin-like domain-containing protein n=1 Tax=Terricaulis sp. TaxID=2768686 RepID=UPI002AC57847|nr:Gmad2 immunoglobulin-like domain-containing protein [Terricaulis sp.]MDZ4693089.1 Gmad2 immunoglobulin-like domain-containing protein [Terricaulis sp.]
MRTLILVALLLGCSQPEGPGSSVTDIEITAPQSGATAPSPILVEGVAPQDWYFEAIFDAQLLDARGAVIAEAPARAQTDWTVPGPVPFVAELSYTSPTEQAGTIVLIADSTGEPAPPRRETRIPVLLAATP